MGEGTIVTVEEKIRGRRGSTWNKFRKEHEKKKSNEGEAFWA